MYTSISRPTDITYSSISRVTSLTWSQLTESWAETPYTWGYGYYEPIPRESSDKDELLWTADYSPWLLTSFPWLREGGSIYTNITKPITQATVNSLTGTINDLLGAINDLGVAYQQELYTTITSPTAPNYTNITKP